MKRLSILFIVVLVASQTVFGQNQLAKFFVGTYTDGASKGIYSFALDLKTGKLSDLGLASVSNNPSFLALTADKKYLLAVHEVKDENGQSNGYIESFAINPSGNQIQSLSKKPSGGAHPCYVSVNKEGYVLAGNYSSGSIGLLKIGPDGKLSGLMDAQQHVGSGPVKARQSEPHVHSAFFEPGGNRIFVPDLGIDKVVVYKIDRENGKLVKANPSAIEPGAGSGPRHLAFHPTKKILYVINELACAVSVVKLMDDGTYNLLETVGTLPEGYNKPNTAADIHISSDGKFLYASNRGLNSIAIFSVDSKEGRVKLIGQEPTKGETPRNFTLSPDGKYLLVANQNSDNIVAFRRDKEKGTLTFTDQIKAPKPVCLLFR